MEDTHLLLKKNLDSASIFSSVLSPLSQPKDCVCVYVHLCGLVCMFYVDYHTFGFDCVCEIGVHMGPGPCPGCQLLQ